MLKQGCRPHHFKVFVPFLTCKVWPQKYGELQESELKAEFVLLHNVHLKEYSEVPKIQLLCCMKNCILKFSLSNTLPVLLNVNRAQEMAFSHSTNINWILDVKNWLISNSSLLGLKQQEHIENIWNSFLQSTVNEKTEIAVASQRNLFQEFFSSNHKCPITIERSDAHVEQSFPSLVCPSNLLEDFSSLILQLKQQYMTTNIEENFWELLVKMTQNTKMLIGYVGVSSVTGRLCNAFQLPAKDVFRYVTKFPKSEDLQYTTLNLEKICEKENNTLDSKLYKRVVLMFENTLAQWYDLLQNVGNCYMLVVRENNLEAFTSFHSASLVKALQNSNSKYPVQMPQNAIVQELSDWHLTTIYKTQYISLLNLKKLVSTKMSCHNSPAYSVSDIISPSLSENIVSLLPTKILSRTHPENMYATYGSSDFPINDYDTELELSTLGCNSIKLVLQDIKSHEELVLFMNLENTSYPLGLLDGAVVEFHLLQRMISQKNKIYCKFIAISSVRVLAASHNGNAESRFHSHFPDKDIALNQMSRESGKDEWGILSLMLSDFYSDRNHLWTQAFVAQVNLLTVKTVCTKCSCLSSCHRCSNKTCNNTQFYVSVYGGLLLDDGTSMVCACTWQEELLLQILDLSMTQWKDLVDLIHSKGGKFCLESKGNRIFPDITNVETSVHHFVTLLCDNPLVKRKWWIKLKRKTPFAALTYEKRFPCCEIGFVVGKIKTKCLPFLQVEILSIQEDPPFDILSI
ncbi:unnamed protein product [Acanthosepion pharaonis]|uniref:CST complex subunit CTC1 n=1 Tax=Acanthosepion pharaonis TaxID=158019 RepID=A0A812BHA7_ACAPH|nr:unnamed protein product [Sepia pharaonis]